MPRFEEQVTLSFDGDILDRLIVPDVGTSVTVEYYTGASWSPDADSPMTSPGYLFTPNARVRFTPDTGGFFLDTEDVT